MVGVHQDLQLNIMPYLVNTLMIILMVLFHLLREEGEKHLVKSFDSVDKSVQSYFKNLNSHRAYKDFRKVRKIMRKK